MNAINAINALIAFVILPLALPFSFNVTKVVECGSFQINWSGAEPPVRFLAIPNGSPPDQEESAHVIVAYEVDGNVDGTYTYPNWPMAAGVNFTVTMSDAQGFGTGGTSDIITTDQGVGPYCEQSGYLPYTFSIDPSTNWTTCETITLHTLHKNSSTPYDYYALSPNTTPIRIQHITQDDSGTFNYTFTQPPGTKVVFFTGSEQGSLQYNTGGSSSIQTIGEGSDTGCVEQLQPSPTDTSNPESTSGNGSGTDGGDNGTDNTHNDKDSNGLSAGAKAGVAVGSIIGAGALIAAIVAFMLLKKRNREEQHEHAQKVTHGHNYNEDLDDGLEGSYTPYLMTGVGAGVGAGTDSQGAGHSHRQSDSRYSFIPTEAPHMAASDSGYSFGGAPPSPSSGALLLNGSPALSPAPALGLSQDSKSKLVASSTQQKDPPRYHFDAGPYVVNHNHTDDSDDDALVDVPPAYDFSPDFRRNG
ncbi:hypothetical protein E3P96_01564 [Wallemia ichthyophaga]|nr:hypothetical protein E3P96_01564 [Wallemia ichthyophaga]